MGWKNSANQFGWMTRILHWLVAAHILGLIGLGWYMVDLSYYDPNYHGALEYHKAFGILALLLGGLKVVWYLINSQPAPTAPLPPWQHWAASAVHHLLLALMVVIPVTGYLISTSAGDGINLFDLFELPALMTINDDTRDLATIIHEWLAYGTLGLVGLHAAAAVKHQFIDRDGTLKRMLW